jgi:hypothetical protein
MNERKIIKDYMEAVDRLLLPYDITFSDLEDYISDKTGLPKIDGLDFWHYFLVPNKYREEVLKDYGFEVRWALNTTASMDAKRFYDLGCDSMGNSINRNIIIKTAYEKLDKRYFDSFDDVFLRGLIWKCDYYKRTKQDIRTTRTMYSRHEFKL